MASACSDDGSMDAPLAMETDRMVEGAGERMMSMDELKQEMFKSLKDTGTIEAIRAQLRRRFIEKLKQHGRKVAREAASGNNAAAQEEEHAATWSVDEQLVHGLIHEYLQRHKMEHTMAVFVPEVGGPHQLLSRDAIQQMLRLPDRQLLENDGTNQSTTPTLPPLVTVLLKELVRRASVSTMSSGSQTVMDLADHRLALEHQLRRVETTYLAECATRKKDHSSQSFEERVLRYQREYDELCEKRMKQDMERFQAQEVGLVRVEERKKFEREVDTLKTTMFQEHRDRLQRLHDRERELEMDFAAKKAELEASLFEARQRVFQDIEKLRVKQQDAEAKYNAESRQVAMDAKRLQLLEESLKVRQENMQSAVDGIVREKERALQLEKLQWQSDTKAREDQLTVREHDLEEGVKRVLKDKEMLSVMTKTIATLESELHEAQTALIVAEKRAEKVSIEKKALITEAEARDQLLSEDKHSMKSLSYENARLTAELKTSHAERFKLENILVEKSSLVKQLEADVKGLQHELLTLKLNEANAVVDERNKFANVLEAEREDARWKENELVGRLRELQSRLAESDATAEKYQIQYEDEKVHVQTLRHEVSSLNALLAQSHSAVSMRHQGGGGRASSSSSKNHVSGDSSNESTDRILMRMMEMMSQMQMQGSSGGAGSLRQAPVPAPSIQPPRAHDQSVVQDTRLAKSDEEEETAKLKRDQEHLERELLEQREFERKKREREEQEEREMDQRRRVFQEELEQERLQRAKHDEKLEHERRQRAAEQETRLHDELEKQKKALDDTREAQKKLLDDQIAAEQARLGQERGREDERTRVAKEEAELAAKRLQRLREQQEEEEKDQERRRRQIAMEAEAEEVRNRLATQQRESTVDVITEMDGGGMNIRTSEMQQESELAVRQSTVVESESAPQAHAAYEEGRVKSLQVVAVQEMQSTEDQSDEESFHSEDDDGNEETITVPAVYGTQNDQPIEDRSEQHAADSRTVEDREAEAQSIDVFSHTAEPEMVEVAVPPMAQKSEDELEEERRIAAEESKKKEDEDALDVYRQRVFARRAAEKKRQQELEEQTKREEEERAAAAQLARLQEVESEDEMEKSDASFASSAASSSGSF